VDDVADHSFRRDEGEDLPVALMDDKATGSPDELDL